MSGATLGVIIAAMNKLYEASVDVFMNCVHWSETHDNLEYTHTHTRDASVVIST